MRMTVHKLRTDENTNPEIKQRKLDFTKEVDEKIGNCTTDAINNKSSIEAYKEKEKKIIFLSMNHMKPVALIQNMMQKGMHCMEYI